MKVIVDADNDQILGAAILSVEGGEVTAVLQMAMLGRLPYTVLRDAIFSHPTITESLNDVFMAMDRPNADVHVAGHRRLVLGRRFRRGAG